MKKEFITAAQLEQDSWAFADAIFRSGHDPDWIIGVARGGLPIALYLHEILGHRSGRPKHFAVIQAQRYTGIGTAEKAVKFRGVEEAVRDIQPGERVLVVDDIFDRGHTLACLCAALKPLLAARQAELRTATLYYKPGCGEVDMRPDFFLKTVAPETWLVFPHELDGLSHEELAQKKRGQEAGFGVQG
jgi:hypoxanthine phosphoribosyltransferase